MHSKNAGWFPWLGGLALLVAGCSSGGGSGGGSFYVETCSLGCTNGVGGTQVTCGVVNTFENQDIALLFSAPVDLASVNKQSFQVFDVINASVPAGSFVVDPGNANRLIFRPKLNFDNFGNPVFGFKKGASYQIKLNGRAQNDVGPFVQSTGGSENQARVLCTITTDQGIIDPVPGDPSAALFVDQVNPATGAITTIQLGTVPPFPLNVSTVSKITFVFDELMNVGTIVIPATGQAPFIRVEFDSDGLISTTSDRSKIDGTFAFSVNQSALTTTAVFTPLGGYPSAGPNPGQPRLVVVTLPDTVADIAGNGLKTTGELAFAPQVVLFNPITLAEDFSSTTNLDAKRTGADWNTAASQLEPGIGGGSGRLGDLKVAAGQTRVLHASPTAGSASIQLTKVPVNNDKVFINGVQFLFKTSAGATPTNIQIRTNNIPWCVSTLVDVLRAYAAANPTSPVAEATYAQSGFDSLRVTHKTPGAAGNAFTLSVTAATATGTAPGSASSPTLLGGSDGDLFSGADLVTNYDFASNPGTFPPDELITDGLYEFGYVEIELGGMLVVEGVNAPRFLARGIFDLKDTALIDLAGEGGTLHRSNTPYGQASRRGGPGGGSGGRGGDRASSPTPLQGGIGGVSAASSVLDGSAAVGVGGSPTLGPGQAGPHWPPTYPTDITAYNDLAVDSVSCISAMVGAAGSGGAYATDGTDGIALTSPFSGQLSTLTNACNLAPNLIPPPACPPRYFTVAGSAASVGLEPPSATPTAERLLTPALGFLRGGSGGGGGSGHLFGTSTIPFTDCWGFGMQTLKDHSAAAGGGGGGALQVQAGNEARLTGQIDASGGAGGSSDPGASVGVSAAPGGGGSGGAVLVQGDSVVITASSDRILIPGGAGGTGVQSSLGGSGGTGLVRVEGNNGLTAAAVAATVNPIDPMDPTSVKWLSVGTWSFDPAKTTPEEALSGGQSCWIKPISPQGAYFLLNFADDPGAGSPPSAFGWNLDVIVDFGAGPVTVPYRGSDGNGPVAYGGQYPEQAWGTDLGSSPLVLRFQGARTSGTMPDPCNVDPNDPLAGLVLGSTTPWVRNPTELEFFNPPVDILRFLVLFDAANTGVVGGTLLGVTNLRIEAVPE